MTEQEKRCSSCGIPLTDKRDTWFSCPGCGNGWIGRCSQCRDQSSIYSCPECGFMGP